MRASQEEWESSKAALEAERHELQQAVDEKDVKLEELTTINDTLKISFTEATVGFYNSSLILYTNHYTFLSLMIIINLLQLRLFITQNILMLFLMLQNEKEELNEELESLRQQVEVSTGCIQELNARIETKDER